VNRDGLGHYNSANGSQIVQSSHLGINGNLFGAASLAKHAVRSGFLIADHRVSIFAD
jgi:hypothetical protein